jgi:hypothetical protein
VYFQWLAVISFVVVLISAVSAAVVFGDVKMNWLIAGGVSLSVCLTSSVSWLLTSSVYLHAVAIRSTVLGEESDTQTSRELARLAEQEAREEKMRQEELARLAEQEAREEKMRQEELARLAEQEAREEKARQAERARKEKARQAERARLAEMRRARMERAKQIVKNPRVWIPSTVAVIVATTVAISVLAPVVQRQAEISSKSDWPELVTECADFPNYSTVTVGEKRLEIDGVDEELLNCLGSILTDVECPSTCLGEEIRLQLDSKAKARVIGLKFNVLNLQLISTGWLEWKVFIA